MNGFVLLKHCFLCDIISVSEKETGENPVRARRREVRIILFFLSEAAGRRQAIEMKVLRRRKNNAPSRNIFQANASI